MEELEELVEVEEYVGEKELVGEMAWVVVERRMMA